MRKSVTRYLNIFLVVAVLFTCVFQTQVSAASTKPIEGFSGDHTLDELYNIGQSGSPYDLEVYPGAEIRIPLTADMFDWSTGRTTLPMEAITISELNRSNVRVRTQVRSASEVLDYVQLSTDIFDGKPFVTQGQNRDTGKTAYISVIFAKKLVSVKEVPFVIEIILTVNGEEMELTLEGVMENEIVDVYTNTDFVKINDNMVANAYNNVTDVKMDLGNGVSIKKNVIKGQKYYGFSAIVDNMDIIREAYPDVHEVVTGVYKIETLNLRYGNSGVTIIPKRVEKFPDVEHFFVYNEDLVYLGKTNEALPYSDLYVLTAEELPEMHHENYMDSLTEQPNQERA